MAGDQKKDSGAVNSSRIHSSGGNNSKTQSIDRGEARSEDRGGLIEGRNAVTEALRTGVQIDKVFIAAGDTDAALRAIASKARESGAVVSETDRRKLDAMSRTHAHQGVIASAACIKYAAVEDILEAARRKGEAPLIVLCDEISDPHNLGAIIRTSEALGAHGVIIPKHRSAGATATVAKTSSGAVFHTAVARVSNLSMTIAGLKKSGVWIYGTSAEADTTLWQTDLRGPAALVIGSEGVGISRIVRENCDFCVSIPIFGETPSLNASVAAAIFIYEAVKQRRGGNS